MRPTTADPAPIIVFVTGTGWRAFERERLLPQLVRLPGRKRPVRRTVGSGGLWRNYDVQGDRWQRLLSGSSKDHLNDRDAQSGYSPLD
jgi:hypothetical protein